MKKLLSFIVLVIVIFLLFSGTKKVFIGAKSIFGKYKEEVVEEDLSNIAIDTSTEEVKEEKKEGVMIPSYWKSGFNVEENDYLKGYIPSIKTFQEYISTKDNILFGGIEQTSLFMDCKGVVDALSDSNTILVDGIGNGNWYFDWSDDNCSVFEKSFNGEDIFVCDNWVNWMKREVKDPYFVLTKCNIGGKVGKCVFLDYASLFFKEKQQIDNRCIGFQSSKFCNLEEYLNLLKDS